MRGAGRFDNIPTLMSRVPRPIDLLHVLLVGAAALGIPASMPGQSRTMTVDGYVASVNDRVIYESEVRARMRSDQAKFRDVSSEEEAQALFEKLYQSALDDLIAQALILEEHELGEGEIPEKAIDERMDELVHEQFNDDPPQLIEALREEQITMKEWRKRVRDQLILLIMRRMAVYDQVDISPVAVHSLYEERMDDFSEPAQAKFRMIKVGPTDPSDAGGESQQEIIDRVVRRLEAGDDFSDVARELSDGRRASDGGDWGWYPIRDLRPELAEAVESLSLGKLSPVIEAGEDKYVILVEDRVEETTKPLDEVREQLTDELWKREAERLNDQWIARLKEKHFVKIF